MDHTGRKYLKASFFHKCQQPCMETSIRTKRKTFGHTTACGVFIISCNSNINHSFTCSKTWEKEPKRLKIPKNDHFSQVFSTSPNQPQSQSKMKTIPRATACVIFIISCSRDVNQSLTCQEIPRKEP